jgi:hypothetical protein
VELCLHSPNTPQWRGAWFKKKAQGRYFTFILYGYETRSLALREGGILKVLENAVQRRIFGPKREEFTDEGENITQRSTIYSLHQILLG